MTVLPNVGVGAFTSLSTLTSATGAVGLISTESLLLLISLSLVIVVADAVLVIVGVLASLIKAEISS